MQGRAPDSFLVLAEDGWHRFQEQGIARASDLKITLPPPSSSEPRLILPGYRFEVIRAYLKLVHWGLQHFPRRGDLFWLTPEDAARIPLTPEERIWALELGLAESDSYSWIWPLLQYPRSPEETARIIILLARNQPELVLEEPRQEFNTLFRYLLEHSQNTYPALSLPEWQKIWGLFARHYVRPESMYIDDNGVQTINPGAVVDENDVELQGNFAAVFLRTGLPADSLFNPEYNLIAPQAAEVLLAAVRDENVARAVIAGIRESRSQQPRRLT